MRSKLICQTHNDDGESLSVYSMWCMCGSCEDLRIEYRHDGITETLEAFSVPDDLRGFAVWWLAHDLARVTAERDKAIAEVGKIGRELGKTQAANDRLLEALGKISNASLNAWSARRMQSVARAALKVGLDTTEGEG